MITINYPKKLWLKPLFILLVIVLTPFALLFSVIRVPFAQRRVEKINEIIVSDWIPRRKYIYVSWSEDFSLAEYAESIVTRFKPNVIFDKWSPEDNEWNSNEPDNYNRVVAFLQDMASEFDGVENLLVATLNPKDPSFSTTGTKNILFFTEADKQHVSQWGEEIDIHDAKKLINKTIEKCLIGWSET